LNIHILLSSAEVIQTFSIGIYLKKSMIIRNSASQTYMKL